MRHLSLLFLALMAFAADPARYALPAP
ncbi:MAG: hypothetical protein RL592_479, partial [Verrucomicrobiota bacterium]